MLSIIEAFAASLQRVRVVLWVLLAVALAGFGSVIFSPAEANLDRYLVVCVLLFLWALLLLIVAGYFAVPTPRPSPKDPLLTRIGKSFRVMLRWILALGLIGLALATAGITLKLIGILAADGAV